MTLSVTILLVSLLAISTLSGFINTNFYLHTDYSSHYLLRYSIYVTNTLFFALYLINSLTLHRISILLLQHLYSQQTPYVAQLIYLTVVFMNISVRMSCSNEFCVEVKQGADCWKSATVSDYQEDMLRVYVRDNPSVALPVALECVRWPKDINANNSSELKEEMKVEYCEKHSNFVGNSIYTWYIGEIRELQEDECLVNTSHGEVRLPKRRIFPCVQSSNFKDESVIIFSSHIDIGGEGNISYNCDSLKLICEQLKARTVCYKEEENRLVVLSTEPQTMKLCETYPDKNIKEIPQEIHDIQADKTYSETLTVDSSLIDKATKCIQIAKKKVSGISSIERHGCSFLIVGSNPDNVKEAMDILDMVCVIEEFPSCNRKKVERIRLNKPRGLKKIELTHEGTTTMKVELVGTRKSVNMAMGDLKDCSMISRVGKRRDLQNDCHFQDGQKFYYATPDQRQNQRNMSVPSSLPSSLMSSESDNSPLSPQQHFPPQDKLLTNNAPVNNHISCGYPLTEGLVPYTARPKTQENPKEYTHKCNPYKGKEHRSVSGDDRNFEGQQSKSKSRAKKPSRPKKKIPSDLHHNGTEEVCSPSLGDLLIVEDSVFTNSENPDPPSNQ